MGRTMYGDEEGEQGMMSYDNSAVRCPSRGGWSWWWLAMISSAARDKRASIDNMIINNFVVGMLFIRSKPLLY